ncbi:hypothetical protein DAI22_07g136200 [Oryza sativa Japonica Group]|jgi:hypothetical protein|nr:hypothetical protein DAI22_07g136200 [Oryza sativa Japonica Group]
MAPRIKENTTIFFAESKLWFSTGDTLLIFFLQYVFSVWVDNLESSKTIAENQTKILLGASAK